MKKILYVTTTSGFLPQFEMNDVKIVKEMGYKVHYASDFSNPMYSFDTDELEGIVLHNISIRKSPTKVRKNIKAIFELIHIIDSENITAIHCHNPMGAVVARIAAHKSKQKPYVIYTAHGFHFYKGAPIVNWLFYYPIEKFLARWTDLIVTINYEDYCIAKNKFKLKKGGFVYQIHGVGVDEKKFKPNKNLDLKKRKELNIPKKAFHIVTSAELNRNKNQSIIIQAIAKINRDDIYYTICGKGPYENFLRKQIKKLGLDERIRLLGFRTDMDEILACADVFAFPSMREGLGIAAVEALLCGVPVVAADNRGTKEYMKHDFNGLVAKKNTPEEYAEMIQCLASNILYHDLLAENCRDSVNMFCIDEIENVMKMIYSHLEKI